jgi:hypothetical protein
VAEVLPGVIPEALILARKSQLIVVPLPAGARAWMAGLPGAVAGRADR